MPETAKPATILSSAECVIVGSLLWAHVKVNGASLVAIVVGVSSTSIPTPFITVLLPSCM